MNGEGSDKGSMRPRRSRNLEEHKVGYGKPPLRTRFQPGQSGNPKGRPKGSRGLAAVVRKVLGRKIPIIEHGQRKHVSADEAMLHVYLEKALKGDVKAGAFLLGALERFQPREEVEESVEELSDQDKEIVDNLIGKKTGDNRKRQ